MITSLADTVTLNNGTKIPGMGLGVFQIPDEETAKVVEEGITNGYRLIDTAKSMAMNLAQERELKQA